MDERKRQRDEDTEREGRIRARRMISCAVGGDVIARARDGMNEEIWARAINMMAYGGGRDMITGAKDEYIERGTISTCQEDDGVRRRERYDCTGKEWKRGEMDTCKEHDFKIRRSLSSEGRSQLPYKLLAVYIEGGAMEWVD